MASSGLVISTRHMPLLQPNCGGMSAGDPLPWTYFSFWTTFSPSMFTAHKDFYLLEFVPVMFAFWSSPALP